VNIDTLQRLRVARWAWPLAIMLPTIVLNALVIGDISTPVRPVIAVWFISVCPGLALVRLLRLADGWSEMAVSLALSITLGVMVATALVYTGWWSPTAGLAILSVISLGGALLQLYMPPVTRTVPAGPESSPS
jgi:hypothetical protein